MTILLCKMTRLCPFVQNSTPPPPPQSTLFPYTTLFRSPSKPTTSQINSASSRMETSVPEPTLMISGESYTSALARDRKSTRLNSSHRCISYAVFCLKKKMKIKCDKTLDVYHNQHYITAR